MWQLLRNLLAGAFGYYALSKYGPPMVEQYYFPTIEYVAGSFHAIAPQPAPPTTFVHMPTAMAAGPTSRPVGYEEIPIPGAATVTGINYGQGPFTSHQHPYHQWGHNTYGDSSSQHDYRFSSLLEWFSRIIYEASYAILLHLRQLLDNFRFQMMILTTPIISWKLLEYRNRRIIKNITNLHELEIVKKQQEVSAISVVKDLEIAALKAQTRSQKEQIDTQNALLDRTREDARLADEAKSLGEEQSKTEIVKLNSSLMAKDKTIAQRDEDLAEAIQRAETAEKSSKTLESNARKSRSDFDSALQKKENDINAHKGTSKEATKNADAARRELKDVRIQAGKDHKKITDLEIRITESAKKTAELQAQVEKANLAIIQKDRIISSLQEDKRRLTRNVHDRTAEREKHIKEGKDTKAEAITLSAELQAQVAEANRLRKVAEAKTSEQETLVAEAVKQQQLAEQRATHQEALAAEAAKKQQLAEQKAIQQEAFAAERIDAMVGEVAHALEQNDVLRATLEDFEQQREDGGADEDAPLDNQQRYEYNRSKIRRNKRADGSIRTPRHPRYTLRQQDALIEEPNAAPKEPAALSPTPALVQLGDNQDEAQSSSTTRVRCVCSFFQQGTCKFGAKCHNIHELPTGSGDTSKPPKEDAVSAQTPASVRRTSTPNQSRSVVPKPETRICAHFKRGNCRFGAKCRDSHDLSA
ncbi:hypothetical protein IMSHALPRED_007042 [Imshaugia aleurites]|uniref:C3H1-type domain-containing protein n=1 Tax=Imshaugia aleurites TaxID=172621 RepID=A0A8H3FKI4_9LECA|nr:hypothetical protein IMSHALPRED_007042 [Imshaugia aleurites]